MAIRHKTTMDISTQVSLKKCVCNLKENYIKFIPKFCKNVNRIFDRNKVS